MKSEQQARKDALGKMTKADLVEEVLKLREERGELITDLTSERERALREEGRAVAAEQAEERERLVAKTARDAAAKAERERDDEKRIRSFVESDKRQLEVERERLNARLRLFEDGERARKTALRNALRELLKLAPIDGSDLT